VEKISVTIITRNEEGNIRGCLESVKWADEIIVSDSGSTDSTVDICRSYGARVYGDEWGGFGAQKNLCASRARNPWVLNIDADERVTAELREEMLGAVAAPGCDGYYIARRNYFGDRWIRRCGWYPDYNLRLYRPDRGRFSEREVHEAVSVEGRTGYLKHPMIHRTYRDVADYMARMHRYSTLAAKEMLGRGRRAHRADLVLRPAFTFLKMFVFKLGFLEGAMGYKLSMLYAAYTREKYSRLMEMTGAGGPGAPSRQ